MLAQMGKEADNGVLFSGMEAKVATKTPKIDYYLLIGKHIDSESGKVEFRVRLKLPVAGNKGGNDILWSNEELTEISNGALTILSTNNSIDKANKDEIDGINYIKDLLQNTSTIKIIYGGEFPNDHSLISPKGRLVVPTSKFGIKYKIDIEKSTVQEYCYHEKGIEKCFDRYIDFIDNGEAFSCTNGIENTYIPSAGKKFKVIKFKKNGNNKCFVKLYSIDWTESDLATYPSSFQNKIGEYLYDINICDPISLSNAKKKEIQQYLLSLNASNTEIRVNKKGDRDNQLVITQNSLDATKGAKEISINVELDGNGNWSVWHSSFATGSLKIPTGYKGTVAEVEKISDAQIEKIRNKGGVQAYQSDDGELYYKGLSILETVIEIKEATKKLCNEAKVPEKAWDDKGHKTEYDASPYHFPTLSGGGDAVIGEVKGVPEFVGFILSIATEPDEAQKIWKSVKSITPASIKKMIIGAAQAKKDKYAGGGNTMKYEVGSDGVQVAMALLPILKAKKFAEGAASVEKLDNLAGKLDDVAEDAVESVAENVDEAAGKNILNDLNDGKVDAIDAENNIEALGDMADNSNVKVEVADYKANRKRGNDFNKNRKGDYDWSEVTVEHPTRVYTKGKNTGKPKRYRLDSYNDGVDIVSRKATDLSKIKKSTFEKHLRELISKYPEGAKIVKPGEVIDGKILKGNFKLEIPDVNANFPKLQEYRDFAKKFQYNGKEYDIEIVLKPE